MQLWSSSRAETFTQGAREGETYWACASGQCNFFESSSSIPTKRAYSDMSHDRPSGTNGNDAPRRCRTCQGEARQFTVTKDGSNKNRRFWTCKNRPDDECGFFEWDDEPPRTSGGSSNNPNDSCLQCGKSGHWARDCPDKNKPERSKSFGSKASGNDITCFKCGVPGHTSNACPQTGPSGSTGGSEPCFNCGKLGHWASQCPDNGRAPKRARSTSSKGQRGTSRGARRGGRGGRS